MIYRPFDSAQGLVFPVVERNQNGSSIAMYSRWLSGVETTF